MNIIPTALEPHHIPVTPIPIEDNVKMNILPTTVKGLKCRYSVANNASHYDNIDGWWYPTVAGNDVEISKDDQRIILETMKKLLSSKDKLVIVEIGVNRNPYDQTSTSIFLDNKRDNDIYVGIDIEDKSALNNPEKNIFTIKTPSQNKSKVFEFLRSLGIQHIDILMIDGWHSIQQVYTEWEYTELLSIGGAVIFHDTNGHPGPYFVLKSIDTAMYDVCKYFTDIRDFGIGVAIRKA